jgi:hypothetical protein
MAEISYRRHRFPPVVIQHAVWLYLRFTLSYRDVEGGVSGIASALVGQPGPPVLIYLLLAGAAVRTVRATLLGFFALSYAVTLASHAVTIGIPAPTWLAAGILIPFAFLGGLAGRPIGDRLGAEAFAMLAIALLAAAGAYTLGAGSGNRIRYGFDHLIELGVAVFGPGARHDPGIDPHRLTSGFAVSAALGPAARQGWSGRLIPNALASPPVRAFGRRAWLDEPARSFPEGRFRHAAATEPAPTCAADRGSMGRRRQSRNRETRNSRRLPTPHR